MKKGLLEFLTIFGFLVIGFYGCGFMVGDADAQKRPDFGAYTEVVRAKDIKIAVQGENAQDRRIVTILPAYFTFDQESGPQAEGILTCDALQRRHLLNNGVRNDKGEQEFISETVLKCGNGDTKRVFVITGVEFSK